MSRNKRIIIESQESKSISAAKKLLMHRLGYNEQQADEFVRVKLRNDLSSLRNPKCAKFILGATRMFIDGQLTDSETILTLDRALRLCTDSEYYNQLDRNLNKMSVSDFINMMQPIMDAEQERSRQEVNAQNYSQGSDYEIVRIDSFEEASKYGDYTSWCITHNENMFDIYTDDGTCQFYFCLKNGFESIPQENGDNCPLDEYGLSMIAVCVDENGNLKTCTCRWNHDNGGDDHIMNEAEISRTVGMNFYGVFKPNNIWQKKIEDVKDQLKIGVDFREIFVFYGHEYDGWRWVRLDKKYNYINSHNELISDIWFDKANDFERGMGQVELDDKENLINYDGKFICEEWYSYIFGFSNGVALVKNVDELYNYIDLNGKVISSEWFDEANGFTEGVGLVMQNDWYNFIDKKGNLISDNWFEDAKEFQEGLARVYVNHGYTFIDKQGNFPFNKIFDDAAYFKDGLCKVKKHGMYNFINTYGDYLSDRWFTKTERFINGRAKVYIDGTCNFINQIGRVISNIWFDKAGRTFNNKGFVSVYLRSKGYNFLDRNGGIASKIWFDSVEDLDFDEVNVIKDGKSYYYTPSKNILVDDGGNPIQMESNQRSHPFNNLHESIIDKKNNNMAKILVKRDNKLVNIGEGKLYTKSQLRLNEDMVDANIGTANGIQQAQMKAKQLMSQNPSVKSASADAGKIDGQKDSNSGEGIKLEVPVNASGQQLAQAQRMTKDQSADDTQITFTKDDNASSTTTNESRLMELRSKSVPFSKAELNDFLRIV